jgi:hypothetical protein
MLARIRPLAIDMQGQRRSALHLRVTKSKSVLPATLPGGKEKMFGWMIVFALFAALGTVMALANPAPVSTMVGVMFGLLFLLGLVTRLLRGKAW